MPLTPVDTTTPQPNGKFGDPIKTGFEKLNANDTYLEGLANSKAPGDALITALAGLTTAANKGLYFTGSKVPATYDLSPQGRTLLAATTSAGQRAVLGLGSAATFDFPQAAFNLVSATTSAGQRAVLGLGSASLATLLGTVSQSGGTPTGAVTEVGSNPNGKYWRFANGLQVATRMFGPFNLASGAVYNTGALSFGANFAAAPLVALHLNCDYPYLVQGNCESGVTGNAAIVSIRNGHTSAINAIYGGIIAVGSWY
ncbi:hypothetical protein [Xanthomonas translucens]|uniref:hypothetical protein n=1 Tax=Xanthomonas campestris pv. translucens TaxID=343 RepID=UPI00071E98A4|nr:hypothetical protein [Xanthomonas translucens]